jgi:hypothetical protein
MTGRRLSGPIFILMSAITFTSCGGAGSSDEEAASTTTDPPATTARSTTTTAPLTDAAWLAKYRGLVNAVGESLYLVAKSPDAATASKGCAALVVSLDAATAAPKPPSSARAAAWATLLRQPERTYRACKDHPQAITFAEQQSADIAGTAYLGASIDVTSAP